MNSKSWLYIEWDCTNMYQQYPSTSTTWDLTPGAKKRTHVAINTSLGCQPTKMALSTAALASSCQACLVTQRHDRISALKHIETILGSSAQPTFQTWIWGWMDILQSAIIYGPFTGETMINQCILGMFWGSSFWTKPHPSFLVSVAAIRNSLSSEHHASPVKQGQFPLINYLNC